VALDVVKAAVLVFLAAILQVAVFSDVVILRGTPSLLLVVLVCVALSRGSVLGAIAGFAAGLLVDVALLDVLGSTSLLLTLTGYWAGRYGETTGRERRHAPYLAVAVATALYAPGSLLVRFILGDTAPARVVLLETLFQGIALNLALAVPVVWLTRRLFRAVPVRGERATEVELLG
jgi:rod shape-determining protein MreD